MTDRGATRRVMRTWRARGERVSGPTEIEGVAARMDGWRWERREQVEVTSPQVVRYEVENKAAVGEGRRGVARLEARRVGKRANCKNGRMDF